MRRYSVITMVVLGIGFGLAVAAAQESDYRILITNDDGIDSPGLSALVDELGRFAEVVVSAPSDNRSGSSHSIGSFAAPMSVTEVRRDGLPFGYGVSGTPADAARFGIVELGKDDPFDLVVSGINRGENVGAVAHLSGTVGAAMEALLFEVPSIAVSQSARRGDDWQTAARFTAQIVRQVRTRGLPPGVMLSINVPAGELQGAVAARMAGMWLTIDGFEAGDKEGDATPYRQHLSFVRPREGGDTRAFQAGYITVTPLQIDLTAYRFLGELGTWDLDLH